MVTTVFDSTDVKYKSTNFDITKNILCQWNVLPLGEYSISLTLHVYFSVSKRILIVITLSYNNSMG